MYLALLKFIVTRDPVIREHLSGYKKIKYLSKTITDDQVVVLTNETRNSIISDVKQFLIQQRTCRSTSDSSTLLFMTKRTVELRESILQFIDVHNANAAPIQFHLFYLILWDCGT